MSEQGNSEAETTPQAIDDNALDKIAGGGVLETPTGGLGVQIGTAGSQRTAIDVRRP
jgi:hypothetical protein